MPVLNSRYVVSHYVFMPHLLIGTRERERERDCFNDNQDKTQPIKITSKTSKDFFDVELSNEII